MNFVPYQWRADGGYQPSPGSMPQLFCPPNLAFKEPLAFVPGPLPVHGVVSAPTPGCPGLCPIRVPKILKGLIRPKDNDDDNNKKKRKSSDKDEPGDNPDINPDYPPTLRPGINYMFPKEHTILHIFNKASPIWEKKYRGQALAFKIFKVSTTFTIANVIERVVRGDAEKAKPWALTEVLERGNGMWSEGTTIEYQNDKAKGSLASMGWTAKRGDSLPPVWVVVHKID